jgi:hypothetical protein
MQVVIWWLVDVFSLPMNLMSQTRGITSLHACASAWNNLFYAHPHPGPLPRGEGEMVAASWQKDGALVHGAMREFFGEISPCPLPLGEGIAVGRLPKIRKSWSRRLSWIGNIR